MSDEDAPDEDAPDEQGRARESSREPTTHVPATRSDPAARISELSRIASLPEAALTEYIEQRLGYSPPRAGPRLDPRRQEWPSEIFEQAHEAATDPTFPARLRKTITRMLEEVDKEQGGMVCYHLLFLVQRLRIQEAAEATMRLLAAPACRGWPDADFDVHRQAISTAVDLNLETEPRVRSLLNDDLRRPEYALQAVNGLAQVHDGAPQAFAIAISLFSRRADGEDADALAVQLALANDRWQHLGFFGELDRIIGNLNSAEVSTFFKAICERWGSLKLTYDRCHPQRPEDLARELLTNRRLSDEQRQSMIHRLRAAVPGWNGVLERIAVRLKKNSSLQLKDQEELIAIACDGALSFAQDAVTLEDGGRGRIDAGVARSLLLQRRVPGWLAGSEIVHAVGYHVH